MNSECHPPAANTSAKPRTAFRYLENAGAKICTALRRSENAALEIANGTCHQAEAIPEIPTIPCRSAEDIPHFPLPVRRPADRNLAMISIDGFFENHLSNRQISAEALPQGKLNALARPPAEFFPQGLGEITRARTGQITAILDRLIAAATQHKAALGPELLTEFTALNTTYATARVGQVDAKGDLAQARADVAATRTTLELQLGRNLLTITLHHLGHPERAGDYFNQALLKDPTRSNEEAVVTPKPQG